MIFFTSDLHLQHNKEFIYAARGFKTIVDMNETILKNINDTVKPEDTLYILGDLVLGGKDADLNIIKRINCKDIRIIIGNHDTETRVEWYRNNGINVIGEATHIKLNGQRFYLCHYPTLRTPICEANLNSKVINLFGHTHQSSNFYMENPWMYHVGLDSHQLKPISVEQIIKDCQDKWEDCVKCL